MRDQWGVNKDEIVLGCVGRLEEQKNPFLALVICAELKARGFDDAKLGALSSRIIDELRRALLQTEGDLLPSAIQALDGEPTTNAPEFVPTHVPVITPSDKPTGDAPPKLEERPLPPV